MRIVVTHLTRMKKEGFICVAGVDQRTGQHIRPVFPSGQIPRNYLVSQGGPFGLGYIVDLCLGDEIGSLPMIEDHMFDPECTEQEERLLPGAFWGLLTRLARPSLSDIFGPALELNEKTCFVVPGTGQCSLGYLNSEILWVDSYYGRLRLRLRDNMGRLSVPITDLRFYEDDHKTIRLDVVNSINRRIVQIREQGVILSMGLSRAWSWSRYTPENHWLQVNNIHFRDNPLWEPEEIT